MRPLNFSSAGQPQEDAWRSALARLGLHALVRFDTVAPPLDGERRLYESLALLLEHSRPQLQRLIDSHEAQAQARLHSGRQLIAELLIDCAACRQRVSGQADAQQSAIQALHQTVRQREQHCVEALLRLYAFRPDDAEADALPLLDGRWGDDLFNPETLKHLGISVGSGVAAGAATGVGIDLLVGGLSLGAATPAGAIDLDLSINAPLSRSANGRPCLASSSAVFSVSITSWRKLTKSSSGGLLPAGGPAGSKASRPPVFSAAGAERGGSPPSGAAPVE